MLLTAVRIILLLIFYTEILTLSWSDTVFLKNKKTLQGKVLPREGSQVLIRTKEGLINLNSSEILNIHYDEYPSSPDLDMLSLYRERSIQIPHDDIQGRYDLALFCMDSDLYEEAAREFRALIPYRSHHAEELQEIIRNCEERAFQRLIHQADWWGRVAHQEAKALALIKSLQIRYPEFSQKSALKALLYKIQGEMERRIFREKLKKDRVLWVTPNFKVSAANLFQSKAIGEKAEELRSKICKVLGISPDRVWKPSCEILVFKDHKEYLTASGAQNWSGATSLLVFDLDVDLAPSLIERVIMVFFTDAKEMEEALAHEIAHVLFQDLLGITSSIPTWISEGFATHVLSDKTHSPSMPISIEALTQIKEYPPFERVFYEQSNALVKFLIERAGLEKFLSLAYLLGTGMLLETALAEVYRGDYKNIQQFVEHLEKEREQKTSEKIQN